MANTKVLRGVELVEAVMKSRREAGEKLNGMASDELARASLGDVPLTPSLRRWLEHDDDTFVLGEPISFQDFIEEELGDFAECFEPLSKRLTAPVVVFEGWGADSRRVLYLGQTDPEGEYPVFTFDTDDVPFACINGPVDVWLAQQVGFLEDEEVYGQVPEEYEDARQAQAKLNFGGYVSFADGELSRDLEG